ncbi:uncharacterized protein N0V89_000586 [Didymosphaeria variabile]|uniref:SnoaL-like domain-containing protein n=1 Tax=Didymosphaeria variabile TaxID=1932322 RepID=A0A9W8XX29_9PLEO|nr:uncharacterized protein N0V89_000586 [Didymosphaeria variabile]KAJ4360027.1 hypothetical protein N0V89_000586 [Didymosphaeria variabile]
MSNLHISNSELRLATATLTALAVLVPTVYYLRGDKPQEETAHLQTFRKLLKAYTTLRPAALGANASKDFSHTVLPLSLNLPPRSLDNFQQHAVMIFSLFEDFKMAPHGEVHFSRETNTVIAHCRMGGRVAASEKGKVLIDNGITEWWTECVLFVKMTPDGTKITELKEFVNSAKAQELQHRLSGILSK